MQESPIQLTDEQKAELQAKRLNDEQVAHKAFFDEIVKLEDKHGRQVMAVLQTTINGIFPQLISVKKVKKEKPKE